MVERAAGSPGWPGRETSVVLFPLGLHLALSLAQSLLHVEPLVWELSASLMVWVPCAQVPTLRGGAFPRDRSGGSGRGSGGWVGGLGRKRKA